MGKAVPAAPGMTRARGTGSSAGTTSPPSLRCTFSSAHGRLPGDPRRRGPKHRGEGPAGVSFLSAHTPHRSSPWGGQGARVREALRTGRTWGGAVVAHLPGAGGRGRVCEGWWAWSAALEGRARMRLGCRHKSETGRSVEGGKASVFMFMPRETSTPDRALHSQADKTTAGWHQPAPVICTLALAPGT